MKHGCYFDTMRTMMVGCMMEKYDDVKTRNYQSYLTNGENANLVVTVTSEQSSTIGRPCQRSAFWIRRVLADVCEFGLDILDDGLAFQIENLDATCSSSTQPITGGAENQSIDNISSLKRVQVFAISQFPQHGDTILTTRGAQRSIGRYSDCVDVSGVTVVVCLELAFGQFPDLSQEVD